MLPGRSTIEIEEVSRRLINIQYEWNDIEFERGIFRIRGDVLDVFPAYLRVPRLEFLVIIEAIHEIDL